MNTEPTNQNPTSRSSRTLVWILVVAVGLTAGAGFALLGGGDDAETATVEPVAEVVEAEPQAEDVEDAAPESDVPAEPVEEVTEEVPAEADTAESSDRPEVPTVVIGQDEDGNDILMEIEISGGCAQTFHRPLDDNSLSFIRWTYDAPGIEPGQSVKVYNEAGFEHFTVVTPDYKVIVEQGINSYGDYPFPSVEWEADDDVTSTIDPFFEHTVDEREGEPSETCLPDEL